MNKHNEHYKAQGIDTFKRMRENMSLERAIGFYQANIDKYLWREKDSKVEDLEKIIVYAQEWINRINEESKTFEDSKYMSVLLKNIRDNVLGKGLTEKEAKEYKLYTFDTDGKRYDLDDCRDDFKAVAMRSFREEATHFLHEGNDFYFIKRDDGIEVLEIAPPKTLSKEDTDYTQKVGN